MWHFQQNQDINKDEPFFPALFHFTKNFIHPPLKQQDVGKLCYTERSKKITSYLMVKKFCSSSRFPRSPFHGANGRHPFEKIYMHYNHQSKKKKSSLPSLSTNEWLRRNCDRWMRMLKRRPALRGNTPWWWHRILLVQLCPTALVEHLRLRTYGPERIRKTKKKKGTSTLHRW